jgi:uncharacterized BrkB/YihY/UPF0761 family membrane protein
VGAGSGAVSKGRERAEALLEKHRRRPLVDVALRIYLRDREAAGTVVGSAVAFRLFLFFVPMLLFLVGIAGFLSSTVDHGDVVDAGISGGLAQQIDSALTQPNSTRWVATGLGFFGMVSTGRSLSKTLVSASCLAWRLPMQRRASARVVGAIVGLITGVGLISLLVTRVRAELGLAASSVSFLAALAIYVAGWMIVTSLLPRPPDAEPSVLVPGALLMAATLSVMHVVSQLYLPGRFSRASQLYGAIGTTIVVLGWFFIIGRAVVLALTVDAVIYERFGTISRFVFSLPVIRIIPRHSAHLRRWFRLPEPDAADDRDAGRAPPPT